MLFKPVLSTVGISLTVLFSSLFLGGCSQEPFLTPNGSYEIISTSPTGDIQSEEIQLPWNTNMAIMQNFLLETSFVLSDLHTPTLSELSHSEQTSSTSLMADFPEPKRMKFQVDDQSVTFDVQTLQIVVEGDGLGQVIINKTITLQGIKDPKLKPAFEALNQMLHQSPGTQM